MKKRFMRVLAVAVALSMMAPPGAFALNPPPPLSTVPIPQPDLTGVVVNQTMLKVLGKALFWDMQAGSDKQACASCHFHAGADSRAKNQLSPGILRVTDPGRAGDSDNSFGAFGNLQNGFDLGGPVGTAGGTASGATAAPNYLLVANDFPFHQLADPENRNSAVTFDTNDVASSQGTFDGTFSNVILRSIEETCGTPTGVPFNVNGTPVRKVEPRNTPTTINAVFNHRNFWDGRANNLFNGQDPLGKRSTKARVLVYDPTTRGAKLQNFLEVNDGKAAKNSSLASQAVGPPLSDFEMSCGGRAFADVGRKLISLRPLAQQTVHATDSLLGSWRHSSGQGLFLSYARMIMATFHPNYWRVQGRFDKAQFANAQLVPAANGYTQIELNFPLFFGLAVQAYEATLVSDQTPFDVFMAANPGLTNDGTNLIPAPNQPIVSVPGFDTTEILGLNVFLNKGKCYNCHIGPEFTGASVQLRALQPDGKAESIERMAMAVGNAVYDGGFYNIGVRPTYEDLGIGADIAGPLSFARQAVTGNIIDEFNQNPGVENPGPIVLGERVAVDGAFKVPTIRNVELTGPYFHNGGTATLRQVVEFYDRGGDPRNVNNVNCPQTPNNNDNGDTSGFGNAGDLSECSNLDPDITNLNLEEGEIDALVAFMVALTDNRVKEESAPFDHPELRISNGQNDANPAQDDILIIPAVGAAGRTDQGLPLVGTFLNLAPNAP